MLLSSATAWAAAKTQASLVVGSEVARPGETVWVGVHLRMAPRWHTYWRNAGESGSPTTIEWTLPAGVKAGEILWPVPETFKSGGMVTYVYHDQTVLLIPLTLDSTVPAGRLELKAKVSWLECEELCVPGKGQVAASLTVGPDSKPSADAPMIEAWRQKLPRTNPGLGARAFWEKEAVGDERPVVIEWAASPGVSGDFLPLASETFDVSGETKSLPAEAGKIRLRKVVKKLEGGWPTDLAGVVTQKSGDQTAAFEVRLPLGSDAGDSTPKPTAALSASGSSQPARSLIGMLGLAFFGGLILNIMPCVLPVIALKILGFVQQSKAAPRQVAQLGFIYTLGVLASFLVLAGLIIAVQQAGRAASWGMQFQNPQFVIVMTTLVTLVALNLFGVFEVTLGGVAMGAAGELASKEGNSGAFFNGVLATALATPCTAPFLTVALGFAFAQPAQIIVLMFLVMGLGLAAPYLFLSWFPQFLKVLPRPGAWMEKFKIAMGFPMLATALWLLTLTVPHFGTGGPLWVGLFLIGLALAVWVWGEFVQKGAKRKGLAMLASLLILGLGYGYGLEKELRWRSPAKLAAREGSLRQEPGGIEWQTWSAEALEKARAEGRPVLVDFTADWCVTCQANKRSSLEIASVRAKLKEINAVALLGDYTLEDEKIARELKRFDRAGVPLVLVYPKNPIQPPVVLPALLTPGIVLDALDKANR